MKETIGILMMALALSTIAPACTARDANPPAPGFDQAGSDPDAMKLADRVMDAMGGRKHWDRVQTMGWTIFGRTHTWNKWTGDYRLEADTTLVVMNISTMKGRVWEKGAEVVDVARRDEVLKDAKSIWINDSYWFVMPYKLKDTGVTLKYGGEKATDDGRAADMLVLTFKEVGDTPDNKYDVYVDRETGLVTQWSFYKTAADAEPRFTLPWNGWTTFDGIMLATGRGKTEVTGIRVSDSDDRAAFAGP
jgi:hypothetical protein